MVVCMKEIHKELNLDDAEDGDLIHVDDDGNVIDQEAYSIIAVWNWQLKNYYIQSVSRIDK